ncbi:lipocalin-like domain-containing protein [Pseudomonas syringae]|uniref:lipocalin-like domain-containing protein n=1 Tax=Pseudomonas syringae TaxID=317 RepID=UPI001010175A|nr:lipocalin-like domain-containing protein [Pseudomonas syringae]RXT67664.1 iron ABC transporter permease [Pseudomonas syringae]RXT89138.1 iron ABC transporter permease [Pseudomonas syringae]
MNSKWLVPLVIAALLTACDDKPQPESGFAGLGNRADSYAQVTPGKVFSFPQDHGQHPGFRIEWWYITATLKDDAGQQFGVQWTLFRNALRPGQQTGSGWNDGTIWLGHAAATSSSGHYVAERYGRGGIGQADVTLAPFSAWIDDWAFTSNVRSGDPLTAMQLKASGKDFRYDLNLTSSKPLVLQGEQGYSPKSEAGQASYYYSQPFFDAKGSVEIQGKSYQVTGHAWLDREWSSQPLTANQSGWDWFSLQLADGDRLMLYRIRHKNGAPYLTGNWISADGTTRMLHANEISLEPLKETVIGEHKVPTRWRVRVPDRNLDITTDALNPAAWMGVSIPYWEGPVRFSGSQEGVGYLEMTGY